MCYDSTGMWSPHARAQSNSPLFGGDPEYGYDIDWQLNKSLAAGMPAEQLLIGVPWYGREWPVFGKGTGVRMREIRLTEANLDPNVTSGEKTGLPMSVVEARNRSAELALTDPSWSAWDEKTQTPYYNWVDHWGQWGLGSYENARSLGAKYKYAVKRGVGIAIWAIDYPMGDAVEWQTLQIMQAPSFKTDDGTAFSGAKYFGLYDSSDPGASPFRGGTDPALRNWTNLALSNNATSAVYASHHGGPKYQLLTVRDCFFNTTRKPSVLCPPR